MKKFVFPLEGVLNFKKHREEQILQELARLELREREAEVILAGLKGTYERTQQELRQLQRDEIDLPEVQLTRAFLAGVQKRIQSQTELLAEIRAEVADCRERVIAASQERQTLEKLREKSLAEYWKQYWQEEQKFIDDVANIGFNRKNEQDGLTSPEGAN